MKKAKVTALLQRELAKERKRCDERIAAERKRAREEYELIVAPPDDRGVCVLGKVPEHRIFLVGIHPRYTPRLMDPSMLDSSMMQDMTMRRAAFEPVMMCQQFGNGQRVIWYEYKFRGLQ